MKKCSLCKKEVSQLSGYTEFKKPLCHFCVTRYAVLRSLSDFRESEEFGIELTEHEDIREINYRLLDIVCYQHFLRRFKHYRYRFGSPLTFAIYTGFFSMFLAIFFQGFGLSLFVTFLLGFILLGVLFLVIKSFRLLKFHKFQKLFKSKLNIGYENGDLTGNISVSGLERHNPNRSVLPEDDSVLIVR